jgi:nicotinamidase-related amidase
MQRPTRAGQSFFDLSPNQVAVLLVDFQNDFCSPELFKGSAPTNTLNAETAVRASEFAARAAAYGCRVIYSRQVFNLSKLTERQKQWERPDELCAEGSWGAELFVEPVPPAHIVTKHRFDIWQSAEFLKILDELMVEGLIIAGVELQCCVLYAVLGAEERGFHYVVAQDLVSGQDPGRDTYNRAVREYLRITHGALESSLSILQSWAKPEAVS